MTGKAEKVLCIIGSIGLIAASAVIIIGEGGISANVGAKIIQVFISYALWMAAIIRHDRKSLQELYQVLRENQDSIGDALENRKVRKLLKSAVYDYSNKKYKRVVKTMEQALEVSETYSDQALVNYFFAKFLYEAGNIKTALKYLENALWLRPYFESAKKLKTEILEGLIPREKGFKWPD